MFELSVVLTLIMTVGSFVTIIYCLVTHPKFLIWLNKKTVKKEANRRQKRIKDRYKQN